MRKFRYKFFDNKVLKLQRGFVVEFYCRCRQKIIINLEIIKCKKPYKFTRNKKVQIDELKNSVCASCYGWFSKSEIINSIIKYEQKKITKLR